MSSNVRQMVQYWERRIDVGNGNHPANAGEITKRCSETLKEVVNEFQELEVLCRRREEVAARGVDHELEVLANISFLGATMRPRFMRVIQHLEGHTVTNQDAGDGDGGSNRVSNNLRGMEVRLCSDLRQFVVQLIMSGAGCDWEATECGRYGITGQHQHYEFNKQCEGASTRINPTSNH